MTKVHFRRHDGRKMAALDVPTYIGAIRVACVGDFFADALGNAAQIALRLASDPVMSAIMPPQATLAIQAVKALSGAAQQGPAALQSTLQNYSGPGAQRVASALNREARAKGSDATVSVTQGFYGLPAVGDASPTATAKGKTGKTKCHWSKKDRKWHCAESSMVRPKRQEDPMADRDENDRRYAKHHDDGGDDSYGADDDNYGSHYAPQGAPPSYGADPYGNVDPYAYQYGGEYGSDEASAQQAAAEHLDEMSGLDVIDDEEPPDYAEQMYAEALDDAADEGDPDALAQLIRAAHEHHETLDAADEDNEAARHGEVDHHEPVDHESTSPQSYPNATRQP